jgi:signal transduction histidine kinase/CheY-like chemotaxis protein
MSLKTLLAGCWARGKMTWVWLTVGNAFADPATEREYIREQRMRGYDKLPELTVMFSVVCILRTMTFVLVASGSLVHRVVGAVVFAVFAGACYVLRVYIIPACKIKAEATKELPISGLVISTAFFLVFTAGVLKMVIGKVENDYLRGISMIIFIIIEMYQLLFTLKSRLLTLVCFLLIFLAYFSFMPHKDKGEVVECALKLGMTVMFMFYCCHNYDDEHRNSFKLKQQVKAKGKIYYDFMQAIPDPILIISNAEGVVYHNKAATTSRFTLDCSDYKASFKTILRKSNNESLAQILLQCFQDPPQPIPDNNSLLEDSFTCPTPGNDKLRQVRVSIVRTTYPSEGETLGVIMKDMTEQMEVEEVRIGAKYKGLLICSCSHELRTPLNALHGNLVLLNERFLESSQARELAENSLIAGETLALKIGDMLDWADLQFGSFQLHYEAVKLRKLVSHVAKLIHAELGAKKQVSFAIMLGEELPKVVCLDEHRMKQILYNLVSNALKYTNAGRIVLGVSLKKENVLEFAVTDTGCGIKPSQVEKLFQIQPNTHHEPDARKRTRGLGGTGLCIHQAIVHFMHSEISVESQPGQGSRFWFEVPLVMPATEQLWTEKNTKYEQYIEESRSADYQPSEGSGDGMIPEEMEGIVLRYPYATEYLVGGANRQCPHVRVFIVDDVYANRHILHLMLQKLAITPTEYPNGQDLVDAFARNDFVTDTTLCLVLMDIEMPVMDGIEATYELRGMRNVKQSNLYIAAVSAFSSEEEREKCITAGMNTFLPKPVAYDKLKRLLYELNIIPH